MEANARKRQEEPLVRQFTLDAVLVRSSVNGASAPIRAPASWQAQRVEGRLNRQDLRAHQYILTQKSFTKEAL